MPFKRPDATSDLDSHDLPEWRRPWTSPAPRTLPQPPPADWDEGATGPGSPPGSVRPPDTTGTVDAPAGRSPITRDGGRPRRGIAAVLVGALIGSVLGTLGTLAVVRDQLDGPSPQQAQAPVVDTAQGSEEIDDVATVAEAVTPSVVRIDVRRQEATEEEGLDPGSGIGSGVIYRSDGYILTNNHVIEEADVYRVRLSDGDVLDAELVGTDGLSDLALLKVDRDGLPAINIRDDEPRVGEPAIAIGSPFGLDASVTVGVISALDRELFTGEEDGVANTIPSMIQTDASINPGNSGGALVDGQGRLVGINTAIASRTGGGQGVGFAVRAQQVVTSAEQLIADGVVNHPLLGVTGTDVTPEIAEERGLDDPRGALVDSVQEGTGADDAGLSGGDIIVSIDGESLATMSDLVAEIRRRSPGDVVELEIERDGERRTLDVELGERPAS